MKKATLDLTEDPLTHCCQDALEALDRALAASPGQLNEPVDEAERRVVRLRDGLIARLRAGPTAEDEHRWRAVLERVNVVVTLLAGVDYPAGGIQREPLEQARKILKRLLTRRTPSLIV